MNTTDDSLAHDQRLLVTIPETNRLLSQSRSVTYEDIGAGILDAVKDGRRTKVTMESIRRKAASLPRAVIKPQPARQPEVA